MTPAGSAARADAAAGLVPLSDIRAARERIGDAVARTPLVEAPELDASLGAEVRLKCENLQRAGSFKARGASNFVLRLADDAVAAGVITYSSGNHAQAVALAARARGVRAVVVMPTTAPEVKSRGAERLGAEVVFEGTTSTERQARAERIAADEGLAMVPPFDDARIIAGQGTVALEVVEAWPEVDVLVVPIGGGGLCSGCAAALRALRPDARIYGVEPRGSASMRAALDAGEPVELDSIDTVADGLAPVRAGALTFRHVRELVDDVVTVDDTDIVDATRFLLLRQKLVVEHSGAATVAALRAGRVPDVAGRRVCAVLSGGNIDPSILREVV